MKKFFKLLFLVIVLSTFTASIFFNKKILLGYNIIEKLLSLKNSETSIESFYDLNDNDSIIKDIIYKDTSNTPLSLDMYLPLKKVYKSSPVILYVHGGSYAYGDKSIPSTIMPILNFFRGQGYTIISTSYELMTDKENFNKQVCDIKDTVRWIYKSKDEYNLDTNQIGVIGLSAGAHLSLLSSYSNNTEFTDDTTLAQYPSKVKYIIDFFGPTDLSLLNTNELNTDLSKIFNSISNKEEIENKYNPINYISSKIPNTLIIHSKNDDLVPYESSEKLYEKCISSNAKAKLISLNFASHDLSTINSDEILDVSKSLLWFIVLNSPNN